jgi:hypothetical protein
MKYFFYKDLFWKKKWGVLVKSGGVLVKSGGVLVVGAFCVPERRKNRIGLTSLMTLF